MSPFATCKAVEEGTYSGRCSSSFAVLWPVLWARPPVMYVDRLRRGKKQRAGSSREEEAPPGPVAFVSQRRRAWSGPSEVIACRRFVPLFSCGFRFSETWFCFRECGILEGLYVLCFGWPADLVCVVKKVRAPLRPFLADRTVRGFVSRRQGRVCVLGALLGDVARLLFWNKSL